MALGARSGSSAARHDVSNLALEVSPHYDMHAVALELTAHTQQYTSDGVLLSLLPDPAYDVSVEPRGFGFSPSTGATIGDTPVTLYGTNLRGGSDYRVRYDGAEVNATYRFLDGGHDALLTITPPRPFEGVAQVTVTLNGQQYAYAGEFGYHAYPAITLFSPTTGPDLGGTQIRVSLPDPGAGLGSLSREWYGGSRLLCRFGHERAWSESGVLQETRVEAHPDPAGASQLLCRLPGGLARGFQALEVSLNGQEFSHSALNFTVYAQPQVTSLSPSSGPRGGATRVRVSGDSLSVGSHYLCGFGAAIVDAAVALGVPRGAALGVAGTVGDANFSATSPATDEVRCVSPSAANASSSSSTFGVVIIPLELSPMAKTTRIARCSSYYDDPILSPSRPAPGQSADTRVTISGLALGTGSHYRVSLASFSAGAQTTLLVEASHSPAKNGRKNGTMGFVTPALPSADMQRVRVSLNAQQYSPVPGVAFVAYPHVALSKLSPRCGHGNTRVLIHGHTNLSAGSHLLCKLGGGGAVVVDATLVDLHTLACLVPPRQQRLRRHRSRPARGEPQRPAVQRRRPFMDSRRYHASRPSIPPPASAQGASSLRSPAWDSAVAASGSAASAVGLTRPSAVATRRLSSKGQVRLPAFSGSSTPHMILRGACCSAARHRRQTCALLRSRSRSTRSSTRATPSI